MSAARLLHPAQRTNAEASPNVCVGPIVLKKSVEDGGEQ